MAGHSQFANIKHRKGAQDIKRSKKFTKLVREIIIAARSGLPDIEFNPRLRSAVLAARKENLPKERIENAIKASSNNSQDDNYEEMIYEAYGPSGIALIIHAATNNRNRTASELRHILSRRGGNLGESGSVGFLFDCVGMIIYKMQDVTNYEDFFNALLELNVLSIEESNNFNTFEEQDKIYQIFCNFKELGAVRDTIYKKYPNYESARLYYKAKDIIKISDKQSIEQIQDLMQDLEENDDVQHIESNFIFDGSHNTFAYNT